MADIIKKQSQGVPDSMRTRYVELADGTHALVISAVLLDGENKVTITEDGEIMTTQTERESDVWVQYAVNLSVSDSYHLLISKDNAAWPHKIQGQAGSRIDITSAYYAATLAINADCAVQFGVVTRIDGTNADIEYFVGIPLFTGAAKITIIESLRGVPSQVKTDFDGSGVLQHGLTNTSETTASVNTATALPSPGGNVAPGLGDVVMKYSHVAASIDFAVFAFYHNTE